MVARGKLEGAIGERRRLVEVGLLLRLGLLLLMEEDAPCDLRLLESTKSFATRGTTTSDVGGVGFQEAVTEGLRPVET